MAEGEGTKVSPSAVGQPVMAGSTAAHQSIRQPAAIQEPELDDFGLPIVKLVVRQEDSDSEDDFQETTQISAEPNEHAATAPKLELQSKEELEDVPVEIQPEAVQKKEQTVMREENTENQHKSTPAITEPVPSSANTIDVSKSYDAEPSISNITKADTSVAAETPKADTAKVVSILPPSITASPIPKEGKPTDTNTATTLPEPTSKILDRTGLRNTTTEQRIQPVVSEWSHQQSVPQVEKESDKRDSGEWQDMPAFAPFDIYDDDGKLIAREHVESDDENDGYMGGAGKGYTRVMVDEDAQSATSMDENTQYLFKDAEADEEIAQNPLAQLETTKDLLTEGERVAYVGLCRLGTVEMLKELQLLDVAKKSSVQKSIGIAVEHMKMWSQIIMVRLYKHMDITPAEQIMIEQLAEHGVLASDLTPTLMKNARVKNPMASENPTKGSPRNEDSKSLEEADEERMDSPPPAYEKHMNDEMPDVQMPSDLPDTKTIDLDIRWTVLCDLFLVLISDSVYDARSRVLLERVGVHLQVPWTEICKFEKRVTDALEMQEAAAQNWNEGDILEDRRKRARNRRYAMMGLATIGGGLVIGLSAGLLAPVIGAGLAAGFTTIGVAGTGSFLAGAGGAAVITTTAALSGGTIAAKASAVRTQSVRTFEFRPLHNNKRLNLIVTVSGWMIGNEDDVRLPYSTINPIMGDIYSLLWEPEMLKSMGQTINLLATEVLTQSLQQVLGSTILVSLMAALQLPVVLTKLSYLLDNPWSVSLDRAWASGLILADTLIHRNLGIRPVTLVGYSLGARVIFSCLLELSRRNAHGLVQNVYMFGAPIVANRDDYLAAASMVRGRFVNGYATNDWILGYLFRATSGGIGRVAGLKAVDNIPGLENHDVTALVNGHMAYRAAIPKLLRTVGWEIESDEFAEIEDPDPDAHRERQIELINDIEEARKELAKEPAKRRFGWLTRNKDLAKKKEWETYEESKAAEEAKTAEEQSNEKKADNILFDVEAIRRELALQEVESRETGSPVRKSGSISGSPAAPRPSILHTNSKYDKAIEPPVWSAKDALGEKAHTRNKSSNPSLATSSPYSSVRGSISYDGIGNGFKSNGSTISLGNKPQTASYGNDYNNCSGLTTPGLASPMGRSSHDIHSYNEYDYDEGFGRKGSDGQIQMHFDEPSYHEDEPVQMTFGTSPPRSISTNNGWSAKSPALSFEPPSPNMSFGPSSPKFDTPKSNGSLYTSPAASIVPKRHSSLVGRPELISTQSAPGKNTNPWADEEDDWGHEKEMTMSFE